MTSTPVSRIAELVPGGSPASALSVGLLTQSAREVLEGAFPPVWVRGEVCDFKQHRNGHWYFCLRDGQAQIRCVVWSRDQWRIPASPDDGMQVIAFGQLTVYPARGDMQFAVRQIEAAGEGLWRKALERTRVKLEAEGLLAPERKRPIPRFPRRIAVVTSPTGAALHDIVAIARRRNPAVEIVVVAATVQGEGAPESLCAALDRVARWGEADVVIVGRGGGGRDDLWAFNDERVARAVAACPMPTISAVGHETDLTICDLVADFRAATPSAAAEATVPVRAELVLRLRECVVALGAAADRRLDRSRERLQSLQRALAAAGGRGTERRRARVEHVTAQLQALSPLATLARGYAVARGVDGRTRTRIEDFAAGDHFDLLMRDGTVRAATIGTRRTTPQSDRNLDSGDER